MDKKGHYFQVQCDPYIHPFFPGEKIEQFFMFECILSRIIIVQLIFFHENTDTFHTLLYFLKQRHKYHVL